MAALLWNNNAGSTSAQTMEELIAQKDAAIEAMTPKVERAIVTIDETKSSQLLREVVAVAALHRMKLQADPSARAGKQKFSLQGDNYLLTIDSPSTDREYVISLYGTGDAFGVGRDVLADLLERIKRAGVSKKVKWKRAGPERPTPPAAASLKRP